MINLLKCGPSWPITGFSLVIHIWLWLITDFPILTQIYWWHNQFSLVFHWRPTFARTYHWFSIYCPHLLVMYHRFSIGGPHLLVMYPWFSLCGPHLMVMYHWFWIGGPHLLPLAACLYKWCMFNVINYSICYALSVSVHSMERNFIVRSPASSASCLFMSVRKVTNRIR